MQAFHAAGGVEVTTIAIGGYRLLITHRQGLLLSITPKATSAGRGSIELNPWDTSTDNALPGYCWDTCGSRRLQSALLIAWDAWSEAGGIIDAFYAAIGQTGHCAMCGATLTDELSMSRGIGPECYSKIYGGRSVQRNVMARRIANSTPQPCLF
jgi:hypothetical protein